MMTILVVDDDVMVRDALCTYLSHHGYTVLLAANGQQMEEQLRSQPCRLIILDIVLGMENGLDLAREIRRRSTVPIIMLSGESDDADIIAGLETAADDYVSKPFNPRELLARIHAVLRRAPAVAAPRAEPDTVSDTVPGTGPDTMEAARFAGLTLIPGTRQVLADDGTEIALTAGKYDILELFVRRPHEVLSRDTILAHLEGRNGLTAQRRVDVLITRLRHKICVDAAKPQIIKTVRNRGYVLAQDVHWQSPATDNGDTP